ARTAARCWAGSVSHTAGSTPGGGGAVAGSAAAGVLSSPPPAAGAVAAAAGGAAAGGAVGGAAVAGVLSSPPPAAGAAGGGAVVAAGGAAAGGGAAAAGWPLPPARRLPGSTCGGWWSAAYTFGLPSPSPVPLTHWTAIRPPTASPLAPARWIASRTGGIIRGGMNRFRRPSSSASSRTSVWISTTSCNLGSPDGHQSSSLVPNFFICCTLGSSRMVPIQVCPNVSNLQDLTPPPMSRSL